MKKRTKLLITVGIILALIVLLFVGGYMAFAHYTSKLNYVPREETPQEVEAAVVITPPLVPTEQVEQILSIDEQLKASMEKKVDWDYTDKDVTNILLIGVDNDYAGGMDSRGNADGLIIVSINKNTKQLILTSILRDLYVPVAGQNYNTKITLAYHYAGTQALIESIENSLNIPIDNYVMVNYLNIIDIVDAVGGLTLDVYDSELYYMQEKIQNLNRLRGMPVNDSVLSPEQAGTLTLNGVQIAAYLRVRLAGNNDFERTERARKVLTGLIDKALDMDLSQINAMAETILPKITTDLDQGKIFSLLLNALTYMNYDTVSNRVPIDGSFYHADIGGAMIVADFDVNREYLYNLIYEGKTA